MKTIQQTVYQCEKCGSTYTNEHDVIECEATPIYWDKGVKIGDKVRILNGDGAGQLATVVSTKVMDKSWGKRHFHSIVLTVLLQDNYSNRILGFNDYVQE